MRGLALAAALSLISPLAHTDDVELCSSPALGIPDASVDGASDVINLTAPGLVATNTFQVLVESTHPFISDLFITLENTEWGIKLSSARIVNGWLQRPCIFKSGLWFWFISDNTICEVVAYFDLFVLFFER